jgi:integrase
MRARWNGFRSLLAETIRRFIAAKRAAGRRFVHEEKTLRMFDRFLALRRVRRLADIRPQLLEAFLASRPRPRPRSYNELLGHVRRLLDWMVLQGELQCSPLRASPRRRGADRAPFIFEPAEIQRLLRVARGLRDASGAPRRGETYYIIFAILFGLGLRVGEVARLDRGDVDLNRQLLVVRNTKFGKSRLVPFGPRIASLLVSYLEASPSAPATEAPLFSFRRGGHINPGTISQTFHSLLPRLKLRSRPGGSSPRVHDLRHAFAVRTLLRWYRSGIDPSARLLHLATFLGHVSISSTAVYLPITDELLNEAGGRFERFVHPAAFAGVRP